MDKGKVFTEWRVTCGCHRDPGDKPKTTCKKSKRFKGDMEVAIALRQLKQWLVDGFACVSRALEPKEIAHKYKALDPTPKTDAELLDLLRAAQEAKEKEVEAHHAESSASSSSSGSDSSCGSDSS